DKYYESIIKIIEIEDSLRYRDYSYYIMEQNEKENLIIENMNRMKLIYTSILVSLSIIFIVVPIVYKKIKKIKYTSTHDGLTNVLNRLSLDKKYKSIIHKNQVVSIIMLDIDNFKNINDTYGHALGDRVLINVCKAITHMLSKDIELYRYGGEEFIVLARNKSEEEILELAENIRYYIEQIK
ncbi:MAG: GGDEF domain-containing protein, partial [Cetobacterium sp.]|uniref:GGDEF domain-containing protein n=1 Tax=Cetobacterium sp. TaxID=2071632 RepID=UPI002FCBF358